MYTNEKAFFDKSRDFMTVRHLAIRGTNFEIGQHLGKLAIERYGRTRAYYAANPNATTTCTTIC